MGKWFQTEVYINVTDSKGFRIFRLLYNLSNIVNSFMNYASFLKKLVSIDLFTCRTRLGTTPAPAVKTTFAQYLMSSAIKAIN